MHFESTIDDKERVITAFIANSQTWDFSDPIIANLRTKTPDPVSDKLKAFPIRLPTADRTFYQRPSPDNIIEKFRATGIYKANKQLQIFIAAPLTVKKNDHYYLKITFHGHLYMLKVRVLSHAQTQAYRVSQLDSLLDSSSSRYKRVWSSDSRVTRANPRANLHGVPCLGYFDRDWVTDFSATVDQDASTSMADATSQPAPVRINLEGAHEAEYHEGSGGALQVSEPAIPDWGRTGANASRNCHQCEPRHDIQDCSLDDMETVGNQGNDHRRIHPALASVIVRSRSRLTNECQRLIQPFNRKIECIMSIEQTGEPEAILNTKLARAATMASALITLQEHQIETIKTQLYSMVDANRREKQAQQQPQQQQHGQQQQFQQHDQFQYQLTPIEAQQQQYHQQQQYQPQQFQQYQENHQTYQHQQQQQYWQTDAYQQRTYQTPQPHQQNFSQPHNDQHSNPLCPIEQWMIRARPYQQQQQLFHEFPQPLTSQTQPEIQWAQPGHSTWV